MKRTSREINIFSLSLMDVISGAMGAFLIVMIILARFHVADQQKDKAPEELRKRLDAAMHALASARAGTEKTIEENWVASIRPKTLGLSGGETVPEITALGQALRSDIDTIHGGLEREKRRNEAAVLALDQASAGTEKIFKDRIGSKPQTLGLSRGNSVPEIIALGEALQNDINTIDKELQKPQQAAADKAIPIFVNLSYRCDDNSQVELEIASDETNPKTGKLFPPFNPISKKSIYSTSYSMLGWGALSEAYLIWRPLQGRHYKVYLTNYGGPCWAIVGIVDGRGWAKVVGEPASFEQLRPLGPGFYYVETGLDMRSDYIASEVNTLTHKTVKVGAYYLGMITIGPNHVPTFTESTTQDRVAEMKAMKRRAASSLSHHADSTGPQ